MPNSKVNINMTNGSNEEQVKVVAAVLIDPTTGLPSSGSSGGGSGGGDASASNQTLSINELKKFNTKFGEEADAVAASPVNTATFFSLFKSVGSILLNMRDRLPPTLGPKVTTQSLSVVPASDGTLTPSLLQTTEAGSVAAGAKMISIKNLGTAAVVVAGGSLPAGETVTWNTTFGTLGAVAYAAGTLLVAVQR